MPLSLRQGGGGGPGRLVFRGASICVSLAPDWQVLALVEGLIVQELEGRVAGEGRGS